MPFADHRLDHRLGPRAALRRGVGEHVDAAVERELHAFERLRMRHHQPALAVRLGGDGLDHRKLHHHRPDLDRRRTR